MRSFITGVGGFAGQHLAERLVESGGTVIGAARRPVAWYRPDLDQVAVYRADLASATEALDAVRQARPDRLYHLAGSTFVPDSLRDPLAVLQNNTACVVNVLEAVRAAAPAARVLVVSSAEVYGRSSSDAPIDERAELRPENPYAASKAAVDLLGYQYYAAHRLHVVRARPFTHIGPGQSSHFVASSFAEQIAEAEAGLRPSVLAVGNLDVRREFTDVRDMVEAYELALSRGEPGAVYNLGRGEAVFVRELVDRLIAMASVPMRIEVDPTRVRRVDAPALLCDGTAFRELTGWSPKVPLDVTLRDILDDWRERVRARSAPGEG